MNCEDVRRDTFVLYKFVEDVSVEMLVVQNWGTSGTGALWAARTRGMSQAK